MRLEGQSKARWQSLTETFALVAIAAAIVWQGLLRPSSASVSSPVAPPPAGRRPEPPLPTEPLPLEGAALKGSPDAKVALIEFSDFQCPFCVKFSAEVLPALNERYVNTGKVLLAFRQFPLAIHPEARVAAEASECASRQDRFWQMHDLLFASPKDMALSTLRGHASRIDLDMDAFETCLAGQATDRVAGDVAAGRELLVSGTPTFFVGSVLANGTVKVAQRLIGAQPISRFEAALDQLVGEER